MNESELIAALRDAVKENVEAFLVHQPTGEVVSLDWMQGLCCRVLPPLAESLFETWTEELTDMAKEVGLTCPNCGKARKCKTRPGHAMKVKMLQMDIQVPKLYLECGHCDAKGVSITRLLTGLHSGDASVELKLMAGYCGAEHSYGKASRDLEAHHGQDVERTAVRRMATEVESWAKDFAEEERQKALQEVGQEAKTKGVEQLMMQGDGGSVRTGTLVACELRRRGPRQDDAQDSKAAAKARDSEAGDHHPGHAEARPGGPRGPRRGRAV